MTHKIQKNAILYTNRQCNQAIKSQIAYMRQTQFNSLLTADGSFPHKLVSDHFLETPLWFLEAAF